MNAPLPPPFCLWEEYQRTGEYRDMMRWLKHRAYCYAVVHLSIAATPDQIEHEEAWIELRRAPGICCPEPSCDHGFHGKIGQMMPHEKAKLECEGCGKACANCEVRPCQLR
jgi:hypothetical protein